MRPRARAVPDSALSWVIELRGMHVRARTDADEDTPPGPQVSGVRVGQSRPVHGGSALRAQRHACAGQNGCCERKLKPHSSGNMHTRTSEPRLLILADIAEIKEVHY